MQRSSIEWTNHTFNPWWGCQKVSEGCRNCYAESLSARFHGPVFWQGQYKPASEATWKEPLKWQRDAAKNGVVERVFCASMGDIFDANGDTFARARVFELTKSTPNLFWLLLTKRPQNIMAMLPQDWRSGYPNVGLGVTVENSRNCERAVILSRIPAVMRFLSLEPLLESIQMLPLIGIDWVICGGESGLNFRGFSAQWAREIRDQCMLSNVAFFYKQSAGIKPEKMPLLDGVRYAQLPAILTP